MFGFKDALEEITGCSSCWRDLSKVSKHNLQEITAISVRFSTEDSEGFQQSSDWDELAANWAFYAAVEIFYV